MTTIVPDQTISVIIPHLNQPEALALCLEALVLQKGVFSLSGIIVVDNGSEVVPAGICGQYSTVTLLTEIEPGPGPARNAGVAASTGDILAFIDADCIPDNDWLAAITLYFQKKPQAEIIGGPVNVSSQPGRRLSSLQAYERVFAFRIADYVANRQFAGTGNLAVSRPVFEKVGPFGSIGISEDMDWGQRAHRLGFDIHFAPDVIVHHRSISQFDDLRRKWDRHIAHFFLASRNNWLQKLYFVSFALAVAVSPIAELPRIATSPKITGVRERFLAMICLVRIRSYRTRRMLGMMTDAKARALLDRWNRSR